MTTNNGHSFDVQQFKYFYARRPECFCAKHPRMHLTIDSLYQCPDCGHRVTLLAAGTVLWKLPHKDLSKILPLPEQRPLFNSKFESTKTPHTSLGLKKEPEVEVEDDIPF